MATLEIDGTSIYYEDTGPGSTGETIAFSHGLLWGTELFAAQVEALRGAYRCIAWDHRGQGRSGSDHHRNTIDMELVWQDAVQLLEHLTKEPVHFCGLSMGGFVAMRMAARRPDLVRSLILMETSADPEPRENVGRYRTLSAITRLLGPKVIKNKVVPIMLGQSIIRDPSRRAERARYTDLMSRRRDVWRAVNGVIDRAAIYPELARISAPTVVIVGDEDVATPKLKAERIVGAIKGAQLVTIPRAGHSSPVEEPQAITRAMTEFLHSLPRAR